MEGAALPRGNEGNYKLRKALRRWSRSSFTLLATCVDDHTIEIPSIILRCRSCCRLEPIGYIVEVDWVDAPENVAIVPNEDDCPNFKGARRGSGSTSAASSPDVHCEEAKSGGVAIL